MFSCKDITKFLAFTGAQGVLIARGAIHNPKIFESKVQVWEDVKNKKLDDRLEGIWQENTDESTYKDTVTKIMAVKKKDVKTSGNNANSNNVEFS